MDKKHAKKIISDNCYCKDSSFVDLLHNDSIFSIEKFWDYHNSIVSLASIKNEEKTLELTMEINISYQRILKEFLYHFDKNDVSCLEGFPENYTDYIERLDFAIFAYYNGDLKIVDDKRFDLKQED